MNPTLLIIIMVVAIIFSVGFLLLVFSLIPAINELKFLLRDLQKTSVETREMVCKIKEASEKINQDIQKVDVLIDTSLETMETASHSLKFLNKNLLKHSSGFLALLPAIKFGWNLVKNIKGGKK